MKSFPNFLAMLCSNCSTILMHMTASTILMHMHDCIIRLATSVFIRMDEVQYLVVSTDHFLFNKNILHKKIIHVNNK